ncbi:MAG: S6e family ribosomal protein [Nitrososphaerales archaeon]
MPKSKLIVADPKIGKSTMYEMDDDQSRIFKGLKIGSEVDGSTVGVEGTIKITGGSDSAGFPMRSDVLGGVKKYVLLTKGVGFRTKEKGLKRRKLVRGNTVTDEIYQINAVLISKPEKKKEATKAEEKAEVPEEKKEEAPKEEKEAPKQKTTPKKEEKPAPKEKKAESEKSAKKEQQAEPPEKKPPKKTTGKTKETPKSSAKK